MNQNSLLTITGIIVCLLFAAGSFEQEVNKHSIAVLYKKQIGSFPVVSNQKASNIYYDRADARVVEIAAQALKSDINGITGVSPSLDTSSHMKPYCIIVGTIGKNKIIDHLIQNKKINVSEIKGKWETFSISVIDNPVHNVNQALVIVGSDPRATAFGIFELSRIMGVSPFYWWADIIPRHYDDLYIQRGKSIIGPPSVKFRGIFINDEDWGLQPWAAKTFEPETGDIGPKTYSKVFELLLRLKANLIWPAMHPSTKPFYYYPDNKKMAAAYSIIIGSSHAEPMLRNNVGEWDKTTMGDFNYITNKQNVYNYWENRVKESSANDAIYTLGMRGVHDSGIEGVKDAKEAVPLLERIFDDQREMLKKYVNKDLISIPQAFTAYKEVLDIYDNNLKLPEDVTLVWPDDNYGYIQRLNNKKEKVRVGGSGIYYHASYWGRPHDYLWLSTTHPSLIREEMMKADNMKANRLWVLNVGDIKPLEYNIEMFLDMAFNTRPFQNAGYPKQHLLNWATKIFGREHAKKIQESLWEYYRLAFERRPEFMGWSQTEPTTPTAHTDYNHFYYGDEAQQRIDRYNLLEKEVKDLPRQLNPKDDNAFYELVYYPIVGASLMNKKFLYRDKSYLYSKENRWSANDYAQMSRQSYDSIIKETAYYNSRLADGKWQNMMSMKPRQLPVFEEPVIPEFIINNSGSWSVSPEGFTLTDTSRPMHLPAFNAYNHQKYFIDIFLDNNKPVTWTASVSDNRINLSTSSGLLDSVFGKKQMRIWVGINWDKLPGTNHLKGQIIFKGDGKQVPVEVNGSNSNIPELAGYSGFIENDGYVSMYADHYSRQTNKTKVIWKLVDDLGITGRSLEASPLDWNKISLPDTGAGIQENNSFVEYDFYAFSSASPVVTVYTLPTQPLNNNFGMRYALSMDGGPLEMIDFRTIGRSEEWKQNVLRNSAVQKVKMSFVKSGKHRLRIYSVDPGVILGRILIDMGGLKKAYGAIPETKK